MIASVLGAGVFIDAFEDARSVEERLLGTALRGVNLAAFLCRCLLAADVECGRLELRFSKFATNALLVYICHELLEALEVEGLHHLAHFEHHGEDQHADEQSFGRYLQTIGEYASVETNLMQMIAWVTFYL